MAHYLMTIFCVRCSLHSEQRCWSFTFCHWRSCSHAARLRYPFFWVQKPRSRSFTRSRPYAKFRMKTRPNYQAEAQCSAWNTFQLYRYARSREMLDKVWLDKWFCIKVFRKLAETENFALDVLRDPFAFSFALLWTRTERYIVWTL